MIARVCEPERQIIFRVPWQDDIMREVRARCLETAEEYAAPGDHVVGANIASFVRVARVMVALGVI